MSMLRYISHANVVIDPDVPVPRWGLSEVGRTRAEAMLAQPWVPAIQRVVSSDETKAREAAGILADHLGLEVEVRPATGETDRSATGFVPPARHHELSDRFFGSPTESAEGWETAVAAQARIIDAVADLLRGDGDGDENREGVGDVAVVGHGGVGTLLLCHLDGLAIDASHDQPGQGHYWTLDRSGGEVVHRWRPIDVIETADGDEGVGRSLA
ncbi:MAG: histidine phosphatase family protein [Actinomycetota bacterium]